MIASAVELGWNDISPPDRRRPAAAQLPALPAGFLHGVASFDPLPDAVLIWTRFTPAGTPKGSVAVEWQVGSRWVLGRRPPWPSLNGNPC
jgi:phosphodiesterase/alkaline phosphatase D-like protein